MRLHSSPIILSFFIVLAVFSQGVYAEYYLSCYQPIPNVVSINCNGHHCRFHTRHASQIHADTRRHRDRNIEKYCDQDMATGDDNACLHPDMQIN